MAADERAWRGRAAILLWLRGYRALNAWHFALSKDHDWSFYLRTVLPALVPDRDLAVGVVRRRMCAAADRVPGARPDEAYKRR